MSAPRRDSASPLTGPQGELDRLGAEMHEKQIKKLNATRQKRLEEDADKLLRLATELKAEVGKPGSAPLSADAAAKADQIAKLAKSVREKMKAN
ncbi:MAG TPA: hypothetical protein VM554_03880 [Acidisarcina sp.]|nr:hypothetical protein [Acidisarcina sp.]